MDAKKILRNSMYELMKKYPFEKITVQMILDHSTLSRSTFYRYFKDKYDLMNWYYLSYVEKLLREEKYGTWEEYLKIIYRFLQENAEYFNRAFEVTGTNSFWDFLYEFSFRYCQKKLLESTGGESADKRGSIQIDYIVSGTIQIAKNWLRTGTKESVEDMARWTYEFLSEDFRKVLDEGNDTMDADLPPMQKEGE